MFTKYLPLKTNFSPKTFLEGAFFVSGLLRIFQGMSQLYHFISAQQQGH